MARQTSSSGSTASGAPSNGVPAFLACTITPPQALHPDTRVVVYQFADRPSLDAWQASPERLVLVEEGAAWLDGRPSEHRLDEPRTERVTLLAPRACAPQPSTPTASCTRRRSSRRSASAV